MADIPSCRDSLIPEHIKRAIDAYAADRRPVGGFVAAVLKNDLVGAIGGADQDCLAALKDIVGYCYWEIPGRCWGSPRKVTAWLARIGSELEGK